LNASPNKISRGLFANKEERSTATEKAKYERNSNLETVCHVLVTLATITYEKSATATRSIIVM
jgi:hypothetical protein